MTSVYKITDQMKPLPSPRWISHLLPPIVSDNINCISL